MTRRIPFEQALRWINGCVCLEILSEFVDSFSSLKFNLEVPYCDQGHELQERLSLYRSISIFDPVTIPPLEVSVLLTIPPLARYQVLVHRSLTAHLSMSNLTMMFELKAVK